MKLVKFDKYEVAKLVECYYNQEKAYSLSQKKTYLSELSNLLRNYGVKKGVEIEDSYRSIEGVSSRMRSFSRLVKNNEEVRGASSLFREINDLYDNQYEDYIKLLDEANIHMGVCRINRVNGKEELSVYQNKEKIRKNKIVFENFGGKQKNKFINWITNDQNLNKDSDKSELEIIISAIEFSNSIANQNSIFEIENLELLKKYIQELFDKTILKELDEVNDGFYSKVLDKYADFFLAEGSCNESKEENCILNEDIEKEQLLLEKNK